MRRNTWFRDAPIKRKLLWIGLLTSGFALLLISLILTVKDIAEWRDRTIVELSTYARVIGANAAPAMLFDDPRAAIEILSALSAKPDIVHAVIYDKQGREFATYVAPGHAPFPLPPAEIGAQPFGFDNLLVSSRIHYKHEWLGSVTVESDLRGLYAGILHSMALIFIAAFLVFLISAFLFARLQKIIVAPILDITGVMQDVIAEQNFLARVELHGKDEVGMLAATFNVMLEYIQLRDEQLAAHREQLETEVVRRTARLTEAQRIAHLGDWEWDIASNHLDWSDETRRILGLMPQQFDATYSSFLLTVHPDDRQNVETRTREALEQNRPFNMEHRILLPDGSVRHVHKQAEISRDRQGKPVRMLGTVQDISAQKQAEQELRIAATAFETQEGMIITDANQNILRVNRAFTEITGYSAAEVAGKNPRLLSSGRQSAKFYSAMWQNILHAGSWKGEIWNQRKNGEIFPEYLTITAVKDRGDNITNYVATFNDITAGKAVEEEIRRSNIDLEQFSYAVSHDMRQPLRMISSYLQLLELGLAGQLDHEKRDYFNHAIDGAKRIDQMLVALLEYSRAGRMGVSPAWIESRAVLDEALLFLQPTLAEAQARLSIAGDWPRIFAGHDEMLRLILNLIGNAAKYRIAGRIPEITVTGEILRNEWLLCVADNGVGIIPDQIGRLFQVFQRLHSREIYEGTGIGLALCRKIAEHHKGRIWAESDGVGLGSKFYVALPLPREQKMSTRRESA